jgi:copper homeostasis protein
MTAPLLEIACFSPQSAIAACQAGADRIELCDNADVGGTTPPMRWLPELLEKVNIPINIMIRPRGGNFVYTNTEFMTMIRDIDHLKNTGFAAGFVFGILHVDHTVDVERTKRLVGLANPLPCTFHRAFDETPDPLQALQDVQWCGIRTVLTSGAGQTAETGIDMLMKLVEASQGIPTIMPGGGVRSTNIAKLRTKSLAPAYHSSALLDGESVANHEEIKKMRALLREPGLSS